MLYQSAHEGLCVSYDREGALIVPGGVLSIFGVWLGHQFVGYQKIARIIKSKARYDR